MTKEMIIKTDKLSKTFSNEGVQRHVLKNLDLEIYAADFTVIMGASGAGKSTLLYALSGMDKPSMGQINFLGQDITKMTNDQLAVFRRRHCGFVFQQIHLIDSMSLMDNVLAAAYLLDENKEKQVNRAKELFEEVNLGQDIWQKFPTQISGGEAQRAGIVRALINKPTVIFADEPTGALNSANSQDVLDVFTRINQNEQSIVMVTHDIDSAVRGNRILYLRDGIVVGEFEHSSYHEDADKEARKDKVLGFLREMGW